MGLPTQEAQIVDVFSNGFTSDIPHCSTPCCKGVYHGAEGLEWPKLKLKNSDHLVSPAW